jgi:hypothetical protein
MKRLNPMDPAVRARQAQRRRAGEEQAERAKQIDIELREAAALNVAIANGEAVPPGISDHQRARIAEEMEMYDGLPAAVKEVLNDAPGVPDVRKTVKLLKRFSPEAVIAYIRQDNALYEQALGRDRVIERQRRDLRERMERG